MISDHPSSYISYSSWWNIKDYINSNPAVFVFIKITTATMAPTLDFHQIWKLLKRVIRKYIVGVIFILFPVFLSNESFQPLLYYTNLYYIILLRPNSAHAIVKLLPLFWVKFLWRHIPKCRPPWMLFLLIPVHRWIPFSTPVLRVIMCFADCDLCTVVDCL